MNATLALAITALASLGSSTVAAGGGSYASHDSISTGSASAAAGTTLYNTIMKPETPLPVHGGDDAILRQTLRNMGSGQDLRQAYDSAVLSEAGFDNTAITPTPPR